MLLFASAAEEPGAGPGRWNYTGATEHGGGMGCQELQEMPTDAQLCLQQRINPSCLPMHHFPLHKTDSDPFLVLLN